MHIKDSALISKLNQRGLEHMEAILARGQKESVMRQDVSALDVFMNLVGLSYYHVANHAGYLAGGFSRSVVNQLEDSAFRHHRRQIIVETTTRFVLRDPHADRRALPV